MANLYKVLGQVAPSATTNTTLYVVPALTSTVVSTLIVANRGVTTTFRIAIRPAGTALANQHYIAYDNYINQYDSVFLTLGLTLATTDVITVYAGTVDLSFSVFGTEIT